MLGHPLLSLEPVFRHHHHLKRDRLDTGKFFHDLTGLLRRWDFLEGNVCFLVLVVCGMGSIGISIAS